MDPLQTIFVLQESTTKLSASTNECKITNVSNTQAILHAPCTVCHLDGDARPHHSIFETSGTPFEWYSNGAQVSWYSYLTQRSCWHDNDLQFFSNMLSLAAHCQ